ncbi:MAG: endonuclease Q family protein, partial [Chloroflexi bacterium]|nr:endonuclease Q family protein [Chloroflexota bacterium]
MTFIADLHIQSRFAMGVSPKLDLATLSYWAKLKGIDLLATGDFTHPTWLAELRSQLKPETDGLFSYDGVRFILGTELSCVYQQNDRTRRLHLLLYAPDFEAVDRLRERLSPWGNLESDGRPTLGISAHDLVQTALEADPRCVVIPAHVWTPWFGVYGSKGGFDSLAECFGDMLPNIHAIETGLSSDPGMNWLIPELKGMTIVSSSDAHSAPRLGREATVFDTELSYEGFQQAVEKGRVAYTLEFYPEEGKYHYDGHRKCGVRQHPEVTAAQNGRCPVCKRKLTVGVASRIE